MSDELHAQVTGLRALAAWLDEHPTLPVPYGSAGQMEFKDRAELEQVAARHGVVLTGPDVNGLVNGYLHFGHRVRLTLCGWFDDEPAMAEVA